MSINAVNLQSMNFLRRGSIAGRFNNGIFADTARFTKGAKATNENIGVFVSISKDSKDMLAGLCEESPKDPMEKLSKESQACPDIPPDALFFTPIWDAEVGGVAAREDIRKISHYGRMLTAFHFNRVRQETDEKGVYLVTRSEPSPSFSRLASTYAEIREELKASYTGEALEEKLNQLALDFDELIASIAEGAESLIRLGAHRYGEEGVEAALEHLLGMRMNSAFWDNQSFEDSVNSIVSIVRNFIMQMGQLARQFAYEGNTSSNAEENRNNFADFVKRNKEEIEGMSSLFLPNDLASIPF